MIIAGARRNMNVIITGNRLIMSVITNMIVISSTNFTVAAELFFFMFWPIFICSMHYP